MANGFIAGQNVFLLSVNNLRIDFSLTKRANCTPEQPSGDAVYVKLMSAPRDLLDLHPLHKALQANGTHLTCVPLHLLNAVNDLLTQSLLRPRPDEVFPQQRVSIRDIEVDDYSLHTQLTSTPTNTVKTTQLTYMLMTPAQTFHLATGN